jgi:hypothetical protein
MTLRLSSLVWILLWVIGASGLYAVKYKVQNIKTQVAAAERQLNEEKRNLHVLDAEWAYLNRPDRLRELSAKYLDVKPEQGLQMADFTTLPTAQPDAGQIRLSQYPQSAPLRPGITLASGVGHGQ